MCVTGGRGGPFVPQLLSGPQEACCHHYCGNYCQEYLPGGKVFPDALLLLFVLPQTGLARVPAYDHLVHFLPECILLDPDGERRLFNLPLEHTVSQLFLLLFPHVGWTEEDTIW